VISDRPFIVDRWYLWSDGELRKQRFRYPTQEDAEHVCIAYLEMRDTTRIRLSKDSRYSNKPTVIKVWEKGM
jgi:hypothetical protein